MPREWTEEQRQAQAERCGQNQPRTHSTGPKSVAGKRKVSQNPRKPASFELAEALLTEASGDMTITATWTDTGS
jgi:hypothetical protein